MGTYDLPSDVEEQKGQQNPCGVEEQVEEIVESKGLSGNADSGFRKRGLEWANQN